MRAGKLAAAVAEAASALRTEYPAMPAGAEWDVAAAIAIRAEESVWFERRIPRHARCDALVRSWVRHRRTCYDRLTPREGDPDPEMRLRLARDLVEERVAGILAQWKGDGPGGG